MKKTITATLLAFAGTGAALAQSSVTIFGVVDAAIQRVAGEGNGSITRMVQGANMSSKLGFRGVEDLGGGYSASFWLEAGMNNDSGSFQSLSANNQSNGFTGGGGLTFNRRSTVSIAGPWGELRLGRDYVPSYWQSGLVDVFGSVGSASNFNLIGSLGTANGVATNVRASNSVGYLLPPTLGGLYGQLMYAMGENPSNAPAGTRDNGNFKGGRVGYAAGPMNVSIGYGRTSLSTGDYVQAGISGSYDFKVVKLMGGVYREEIHAAATARNSAWYLGVLLPMGPGQIKASLTSANQNAAAGNNDGTQIGLGYVYDLSKRTSLYATYSLIDNKGTSVFYSQGRPATTPGGRTTGVDLGLRHVF